MAHDFDLNSLAVPRKAKEAIGAIARLTHKDGRSMTVNVEYNQLDPLLRATTYPDGDINDSTGFSPFPGGCSALMPHLRTSLLSFQTPFIVLRCTASAATCGFRQNNDIR